MFTFTTDYYLFIVVASFGIIQLAASLGGLRGLLIVKNEVVTRILGVALAVVAAVWFFDPVTRNINDYEGGWTPTSRRSSSCWGPSRRSCSPLPYHRW